MDFFSYLYAGHEKVAMDAQAKPVRRHHPDGTPCFAKDVEDCPILGKEAAADDIDASAPSRDGKKFLSREQEDEGVKSYVTSAEYEKGKWVEKKVDKKGKSTRDDHDKFGKKGKHDKWIALPEPDSEKIKKERPNFDSFADEEPRPYKNISQFPPEELYVRSNDLRDDAKEGEARYLWMRDGKELNPKDSLRLEKALLEAGYTGALNPQYSEVRVRPDLCNGTGQVTQYHTKDNGMKGNYGPEFLAASNRAKFERVNKLYKVYDQIKDRIYDGVKKDDPNAWLAYFMLRTKVRIGSASDPKGGRGASDLARGDVSLANDGETFYLSFNAKSKQWWHVTAKDPILYDYLAKRKKDVQGSGANKKPLFEVSYGKFCDYLKNISQDLTGDPEVYFKPHDFRRCGATRVAEEMLEKSLKGIDPKKDRKKWEDRIAKASIAAAQHLNDTPTVAFSTYILPNILFRSSPEDMERYFPYTKGLKAK